MWVVGYVDVWFPVRLSEGRVEPSQIAGEG